MDERDRPVNWRVREAKPADYDALRAAMTRVFEEIGGQKISAFGRDLWEWQYLRAELPSVVVLADDDGRIAGYFHMPVYAGTYHGRAVRGSVTCDLATLPEYRRQGMMQALDTHARTLLAQRGVDLVLGVPNWAAHAGFVNHGPYSAVATVPTYVRPLDWGRMLERRRPPFGRLAGRLVGPAYRLLASGSLRPAPLADAVPIERFDADIEPVSAEFATAVPVSINRTARYLNWRFRDKPGDEYEAWGVRRAGHWRAYVVTRTADLLGADSLVIVDLGSARGEEEALLALIGARLAAARDGGLALCLTMGIHPFFRRLGALGFLSVPERLNPRSRGMIATALAPGIGPDLVRPESWLLTLADWDVM